MKRRYALISGLLSVLLLTGCGSNGPGGDGGDDAAQIDAAIHTAALVHRPGECAQVATQAFLEQVTNRIGDAAVLVCEEEAEDPLGKADTVTVSKVAVDGSSATAKASFTGLAGTGGLQRETVAIALVKAGGRWKLDRLTGYRTGKLDQSKISEDPADLTSEEKQCLDRRRGQWSPAESEQAERSKPFSRARFDDQYAICFKSDGAGSGDGQEISPKGSLYSYRVPPGFEPFTPREYTGLTTSVHSPSARNSNASIVVVQVEGMDVHDAADLKGFEGAIEEMGEEFDSKGSTVSLASNAGIPGHRAVRYTVVGGHGQHSPGVDEEAILVFTSNGNDGVEVLCSWGRTAAEEQLLHRGCDALLGSLHVD